MFARWARFKISEKKTIILEGIKIETLKSNLNGVLSVY